MPIKQQYKHNQEIMRILNDAWLGIDVHDNELENPLEWPSSYDEIPHKFITWILSEPEYFSFICSEILNVKIIPLQAVILQELWHRKFPMLIASRGFGKTFMLAVYCLLRMLLLPNRRIVIAGGAFRQSKFVFEYMESIWRNADLLRDIVGGDGKMQGPHHDTDMWTFYVGNSRTMAIPIGDGCGIGSTLVTYNNKFGILKEFANNKINKLDNISCYGNGIFRTTDECYNNGQKDIKLITTKRGYSFGGTYNHALKVLDGDNIIWRRLDEMKIGDKILVDNSERWHEGNFACSNDQAYALGAMIGDGCWTNIYKLSFASKDIDIVNRLESGMGKIFTPSKDGVHYNCYGKDYIENWLDFWNLKEQCHTKDKCLPPNILSAPKEQMTACLQGLFDTDGHVFSSTTKGDMAISVNFTNTSETLVRQIQYILLHYGIVSVVKSRQRKNWNKVFELGIYGINVKKFAKYINFYLPRKKEALEFAISKKQRWVSQEIYHQDILIDVIDSISDDNADTYDIHVPDGNEYCANGFFSHNSKIRGLRANDLITDEFDSVPREIFEVVLSGFASVKSHPIEGVIDAASEAKARELGYWDDETEEEQNNFLKDNQIIISGTAGYDFNSFGYYHTEYRDIIRSKGNPDKIETVMRRKAQALNKDFTGIDTAFNWKDYSIIRIPVEVIPPGFMDMAVVSRSKATSHLGIYQMEYGACFAKDSNGFFKRSLIESCVASPNRRISHGSAENIVFEASLFGNTTRRYVYGVDPAFVSDNFSITLVEMWPDHRRVVYCWTTTKEQHIEEQKSGLIDEQDFYAYCAKKIRTLMKRFPCERIMIDSQGGGVAVIEALADKDKRGEHELPILPIIDPDKPKETDNMTGLHIIEACNFALAEWTAEANHGLRKDMEDKVLLLPYFDPVTLANAQGLDKLGTKAHIYDSLEDCVLEIEEMKRELSTIVMSQTPSGRDKWDTPEVKLPGGKKGRMRKDRYSALLMANMGARLIMRSITHIRSNFYGGIAEKNQNFGSGQMYSGNEKFNAWAKSFYKNL